MRPPDPLAVWPSEVLDLRLVLLSGGLDSGVALAWAVANRSVDFGLFFDYGQRALVSEKRAATALAEHYGIPLRTVPLPFLADIRSGLTGAGRPPILTAEDLDNGDLLRETAAAVWVPNRNGVFLNVAAALLDEAGGGEIIVGFNREEAETFADNSIDFLGSAEVFFRYSCRHPVRVLSPLSELDKQAIVRFGLELGFPFSLVWSCYLGGENMCGECESCRRLRRAYQLAGRSDLWKGDR